MIVVLRFRNGDSDFDNNVNILLKMFDIYTSNHLISIYQLLIFSDELLI